METVDTIIIGAGQAGLSTGYHLARRGMSFVILEAANSVGEQWRNRWDSLRLFTPARYDGLDGMRFPAHAHYFPTKNEMADFLGAYAAHFELPIRTGLRVDRVWREAGALRVRAGSSCFEANNVVVAMSNYQRPRVPAFASQLDDDIVQLHSSAYRNPRQLREGGVLIAGAGNSGSEIATELARAGHPILLSGRDTGHLPFRIAGAAGRYVFVPIVLRGLFHRLLTIRTPLGRKVRPRVLGIGGPLIRVHPADLQRLGVQRVGRMVGVRDGRPLLADGRVVDVANVIWCTGFHAGFSWIDLPIFDASGEPVHERGVVAAQPGLYFVGLHFLYSMSSTMIHGVGRDAAYIADRIVERSARRRLSRADGGAILRAHEATR